jgi:uncharacterized membrane protein YbhN (UPF0104 family)
MTQQPKIYSCVIVFGLLPFFFIASAVHSHFADFGKVTTSVMMVAVAAAAQVHSVDDRIGIVFLSANGNFYELKERRVGIVCGITVPEWGIYCLLFYWVLLLTGTLLESSFVSLRQLQNAGKVEPKPRCNIPFFY